MEQLPLSNDGIDTLPNIKVTEQVLTQKAMPSVLKRMDLSVVMF